jgi:hypothetical protein
MSDEDHNKISETTILQSHRLILFAPVIYVNTIFSTIYGLVVRVPG